MGIDQINRAETTRGWGEEPSPSDLRGKFATAATLVFLITTAPTILPGCDHPQEDGAPGSSEIIKGAKFKLDYLGADTTGVDIAGSASEATTITLRVLTPDGVLVHAYPAMDLPAGDFEAEFDFGEDGVTAREGDRVEIVDDSGKGTSVELTEGAEMPQMPHAIEVSDSSSE